MNPEKLAKKAKKRQNRGNVFTEYAHWILLIPFLTLFLTLIILPIICAIVKDLPPGAAHRSSTLSCF